MPFPVKGRGEWEGPALALLGSQRCMLWKWPCWVFFQKAFEWTCRYSASRTQCWNVRCLIHRKRPSVRRHCHWINSVKIRVMLHSVPTKSWSSLCWVYLEYWIASKTHVFLLFVSFLYWCLKQRLRWFWSSVPDMGMGNASCFVILFGIWGGRNGNKEVEGSTRSRLCDGLLGHIFHKEGKI